jgi:predicted DNA binding CopG/RHH family protein
VYNICFRKCTIDGATKIKNFQNPLHQNHKKERYKYQMIPNNIMNKQINLRLSEDMEKKAKIFAKKNGFANIQEFIKETLREKLFEKENIGGIFTYSASEKSLAKYWMTKKEDKAWEHLQE